MAGTFRKTSATGLGQAPLGTGFEIEGGTIKKTLTVTADVTLDQALAIASSPTFAGLTIDDNAITSIEDVAATLTDNDAALPTSAAVIDYVGGQMASAGMVYSEVTSDTSPLIAGSGYIVNKAGTMWAGVLPAAATVGRRIGILVKGATGASVQAAATDTIIVGNLTSIAAGIIKTAAVAGGAIILQCITTDSVWEAENIVGNWLVETA